MAGSISMNSCAPVPHATHCAALGATRLIRAVTGPLGSRLVRQIEPSPGARKHGSPRTAAKGRQRVPEADGPGKHDRARALHLMILRLR